MRFKVNLSEENEGKKNHQIDFSCNFLFLLNLTALINDYWFCFPFPFLSVVFHFPLFIELKLPSFNTRDSLLLVTTRCFFPFRAQRVRTHFHRVEEIEDALSREMMKGIRAKFFVKNLSNLNLIGFLVAFGKFYQFLNFHVSYLKWKMTRTQLLALKHLAHAIYCAFWRCENPFLIFLIFQLNTYKHFVKKRYVFFSWNWIVSALLQKLSSWASTIELLLYCSCKTFYFPLLILC